MKLFHDLFVKSLCLTALGLMSSVALAKPLSPVQISIAPVQPVVLPGQPAEFIVRAYVNADAQNLQIIVSLPPLVKIISGEWTWQGSLSKGEEKQLRFTAIFNASADQLLEAQAVISTEGVSSNRVSVNGVLSSGGVSSSAQESHLAQFSASATYLWRSGAAGAASSQVTSFKEHEKPRIIPGHGRDIAEFTLRP